MAPTEIRLALVSQVDELSTTEVTRVARAIQTQLARDFAPLWQKQATITPFQTVGDVPTDHWPVVVQPESSLQTPGYHSVRNGAPFAVVQHRDGWSLMASHECLEMLVDPFGQRVVSAQSPKSDQGKVHILTQVCDPCAASEY